MRVYLPALPSELAGPTPPVRDGFAALPQAGAAKDDIEVLEDDAQSEAALASLVLARESDSPQAPARLVLALDVPDSCAVAGQVEGAPGVHLVPGVRAQWGDAAAILADGAGAAPAVRRVLAAATQEGADRALCELWDEALEWFDITERPVLASALCAPARTVAEEGAPVRAGAEEGAPA